MRRKLFGVLAAALLALVAVLAARAWRLPSRQLAVAPIPARGIDGARHAITLAAAIRCPTISQESGEAPAEALTALQALLAERFPRLMAAVERERVDEWSLLLRWPGSEPSLAPVLLLAHQDVVPIAPGTESDWHQPPFSGAISGGFVWGRGAIDDKGSLIAELAAAETLLDAGFRPRRDVWFAFGHDEEVGGTGAAAMAERLAARGVAPALVLDEGMVITDGIVPGVAAPVALIGVAEKGFASVELAVEAEGGHSSMPRRETAISILAAALARVTARPLPARADAPGYALVEALAPEMGFASRLALANLWLFRPLVERRLAGSPSTDASLRTTLVPTIVEGGVKENVIPSRARAVVNLRLLPGDTAAAMVAEIEHRAADPRVRVALVHPERSSEASPVSSPAAWGFERVARAVREVLPEARVAPALVLGATDARHYTALSAQILRLEPIRFTSDDLPRVHGTDERLSVANLELAIRIYARILENAAGS